MELNEILQNEIAAKVISTLPDEQKNAIIAAAVEHKLTRELFVNYEIGKMLSEYGMAYAFEYAQKPEVQETLKREAKKAVDDVLDGIIKIIGRTIENDIKNQYRRILSEKTYGEKP